MANPHPKPGPGRPKGIPNKTTTSVKEMILRALDKAGGDEYLLRQAQENPGPFMTLVGKVLPLAVTGEDGGPVLIVTGVRRASDKEAR